MKRIRQFFAARRIELLLFALFFISYGYFSNGPAGPNTVSRLALSLSLVENGSLYIDRFADSTGDKAKRGDHYLSDKAPGMTFLSLPVVAAYVKALPLKTGSNAPPDWPKLGDEFRTLSYFSALTTSSLLTAIAAVCLYSLVLARSGSTSAALIAALTYGLGTTTWGWATAFFGHAAAGALLVIGLSCIDYGLRRAAKAKPALRPVLLAGLPLGCAITVEFTSAPAVALILLYGLIGLWRQKDIARAFTWIIAAGLIVSALQIPLFIYNTAAFGGPLELGYGSVQGFAGMKTGFFGISPPKLDVLLRIIFGTHRGFLELSPVLIFAPLGIYLSRNSSARDLWWLIIAIASWYLLMNSGYYYWDGDASTGPRHITPIYPFLAISIAFVWTKMPRLRPVIAIALAASILVCLMCVSVNMMGRDYKDELFDYIAPRFFSGHLDYVTKRLFGLQGVASLLPLAIVWAAIAFGLWRFWPKRAAEPAVNPQSVAASG